MQIKEFRVTEKAHNDEELTISHYISTVTPDRYGDIVNPYGMNAVNYKKNPVVLFGHNSRGMVIGKNIELSTDEHGVKAVTKFADTTAGRDIYKLNRDGFLNAWSIGFIPGKQEQVKHEDGNTYNHITEWELLEYSSVPVPANPDCLNLMLKGLETDGIKEMVLTAAETAEMKKELLEEIEGVRKEIGGLKEDFARMKEDIDGADEETSENGDNDADGKVAEDGLKEDVTGIRKEVLVFTEDNTELKNEVASIRKEAEGFREEVTGIRENEVKVKEEIEGMKEDFEALKKQLRMLENNVSIKLKDLIKFVKSL
jgi:HK97 family phage prohead protease